MRSDPHLPRSSGASSLTAPPAEYDLWFYTPMALPARRRPGAARRRYDCMDELSAFKYAPPRAARPREASFCARADVVFTGGPSLYRAKKDRHPNVPLLPVAASMRAHFGQAAGTRWPNPPTRRRCRARGSGFFGVIDERFDVPLLEALARPARTGSSSWSARS